MLGIEGFYYSPDAGGSYKHNAPETEWNDPKIRRVLLENESRQIELYHPLLSKNVLLIAIPSSFSRVSPFDPLYGFGELKFIPFSMLRETEEVIAENLGLVSFTEGFNDSPITVCRVGKHFLIPDGHTRYSKLTKVNNYMMRWSGNEIVVPAHEIPFNDHRLKLDIHKDYHPSRAPLTKPGFLRYVMPSMRRPWWRKVEAKLSKFGAEIVDENGESKVVTLAQAQPEIRLSFESWFGFDPRQDSDFYMSIFD